MKLSSYEKRRAVQIRRFVINELNKPITDLSKRIVEGLGVMTKREEEVSRFTFYIFG